MSWISPEVFGAFVTAGGVALYGLKRLGILKLEWTRNSKNNHTAVSKDQRPECGRKFALLFYKIDTLGTDRTSNMTNIKAHEKRLDKGDEKFDKIMDGISTITTEVRFLAKTVQKINDNHPNKR